MQATQFSETSYGPPLGNGTVLDGFPDQGAGTSVNGGVILGQKGLFGVTESGGKEL
jgi:hypothetical protein